MLRKLLDGLYLGAGYAAGAFLVIIFAIMMVMSVGRQFAAQHSGRRRLRLLGDGRDGVSRPRAHLQARRDDPRRPAARKAAWTEEAGRGGRRADGGARLHSLFHAPRHPDDLRLVALQRSWRPACSRCRCGFRRLGFSGGLTILSIALVDELVNVVRGNRPSYEQEPAGRVAGGIRRAHQPGRRRLMFATPGMVELSLILLGFMILVLASGVWIAVSLGLVGFVAMALTTSVPLGTVLATTTWSASSSVDARRAAAVHLDGRDSVPHQAVRRDVPRPLAVGAVAAGTADPCERDRLRHLRGGVGLVGGDLRDDRQDLAARTRQARLRQRTEPRLARRRRHARPADPAVDPDGGLCGDGERLGAAGFPRAASCRACS